MNQRGAISEPVSNDELDWLTWRLLQLSDKHPATVRSLIAEAGGQSHRITARMQAMRKAGRIRWHHPARIRQRPAHVRAHGWEVLGCPGYGGREDGQWHWREGCEDCARRTRPDPADGVVEPPPIVAFECELKIEPSP
jgi:hypothetical protein